MKDGELVDFKTLHAIAKWCKLSGLIVLAVKDDAVIDLKFLSNGTETLDVEKMAITFGLLVDNPEVVLN